MKIKYLMIVSLILAILTIGAVCASEISDDLAVSEEGVEIEETPIEEVISSDESEDSISLSKDNFTIDYESYCDDLMGNVIEIESDMDTEDEYIFSGTFTVFVGGNLEYTSSDDMSYLYVSPDELGINKSGYYDIEVKFSSGTDQITLCDFTLNVDLDDGGEDDIDVRLYDYLDVKNPKDPIGFIEDMDNPLNGTVTVTIGGRQYLSKKLSSIYEYEITVADLNLLNAAFGRYLVNITYVSSEGDKYSAQGYVNFTTVPEVYLPRSMSVGEKTGIIISGDSSISGTYTVYNAVSDEGDYKKGSIFQTGKITNGYAKISFEKLSEGSHAFFIDYTFGTYSYVCGEYDYDYVYVYNNTQGFSSSISASTITVGDTVTVKLTGPKSDEFVYIYIDGKQYKSVKLITGEIVESISGLSVGAHDISVRVDDGDVFYSNTFPVTVNGKPVNPPAPAAPVIKLALKKVNVKKSAKKLTLSATLKINGKAASGKVLTFKFNKKTLKAKTNKKGVAKAIFKGKVLKKLKVGKKVAYQVSYNGAVKKLSVKVKK